MCQHQEDLHNSVHFPYDIYNVTKSCIVKQSFKVQVRLMGFNVTEFRKLTDMITEFTVQLTFKQSPPAKYWGSRKEDCMQ